MEKLSDELLKKVFEQLTIEDLAKCRLLCKRFKSLIGEMKLEELVLDDDCEVKFDEQRIYRKFHERTHWFDTELSYTNVVKINSKADLSSIFQSSIFDLSELKRLRINISINNNRFKISDLNRFVQLEHLEIGGCNGSSDELYLPNLKTLYFRSIHYDQYLDVTAPLLRTLSSLSLDQIQLKQRETIKQIETDFFNDDCFAFKNLEYLIVYDIMDVAEKYILKELINLKRIKIQPDDCQCDIYYECIQNLVRNLLDEKELFQRDELEIIVDGKKITSYCEIVDGNSFDESFQLLCLEDYFDIRDF